MLTEKGVIISMRYGLYRETNQHQGHRRHDVQHAEAGVLDLVQVAAVCAKLLDGFSKNFLPKGVAQPRYDLKEDSGRKGRGGGSDLS